jgi:Chaperone of endosialidase
MAVTIVRTPWIDDDGSGTTGTVLNNAIKTELYGQIDGALAQLVSGSNGLLNITTFGTNNIVSGGTGFNILSLGNTTAGAGNGASLGISTDASGGSVLLQSVSSSYTAAAPLLPGGSAIRGIGVGGLSLSAEHSTGAIRFYTGGTTERMRLGSDGKIAIGPIAAGVGKVSIASNQTTEWGMGIYSLLDTVGSFVNFVNASAVSQGSISAVNASTVAYNTTSDQRLKEDLGVADDLTALRAVVVHDFVWSAHGGHDRGVFAQEAHPVFPRAVCKGSDGDDLSKPWMTDYSKFVPDLIVGWQEHDRRLARLESLVSPKD